jgi:hypothetical protein
MEMIHVRQLAATHRLKIGIVEDGCGKVALATIHFIEFHAVCHDLLRHQAARTIRRRPRWHSARIATLKQFTGDLGIGYFVIAITRTQRRQLSPSWSGGSSGSVVVAASQP